MKEITQFIINVIGFGFISIGVHYNSLLISAIGGIITSLSYQLSEIIFKTIKNNKNTKNN